MRRTSLIAAAIGSLFVASSSFAAFTLSVAPSAQPATGAGLAAYDIFAQNDSDTADGVNLQGVAFTFTGLNGTKALFSGFDNGDGTWGTDQFNFGAGTSGTNVSDVNRSNLRIGTRTAGQHGYVQYPGDADSPLTAEEANTGVTTFSADYAVLSAAASFPASTAPGARFARLVVSGGAPAFRIQGQFGGEVGAATSASVLFGDGGGNVAPVINSINPNPVDVLFGQIVSNGAPFSTTINATDADVGDVVTLSLSADADVSGVTIVPGANGDFQVSGTVAYGSGPRQIALTVTASDGEASTTSVLTLNVVPEPTSLAVFGLSGLFLGRRRK